MERVRNAALAIATLVSLMIVSGCGNRQQAGDTSSSDEPSDAADSEQEDTGIDVPVDDSTGDPDIESEETGSGVPMDPLLDDPEWVGDALPLDSGI